MNITFLQHGRYLIYLGICFMLGACDGFQNNKEVTANGLDYSIDISGIPNDTINATDPDFYINNGLFYVKNKKYSGIIKKYHYKVGMTAYISVFNGKRHGAYSSFYDNGLLFETKQYKQNRVMGRQLIYWKNGNVKSDYNYYDGKMEGTQKKWYTNGTPFYVFNYTAGKREGKQQAWRTSGKLQINNEIINGRTYGLNRASLCYNVEDEKPVIEGYAEVRK